ncbi:site-specific integrase [Aulosira sp. FACHB-615]|uniref:site-specific integrase n=1 Tax=Aulosira sp. FACHB-615 TaxID=2692777 RepID=UPI001686B9D2|nr:site-specific integrase [Aulosira sp. FACHB-615]MBD2491269.1 site-specific integrase [Aulosira sp. FACHB-615]
MIEQRIKEANGRLKNNYCGLTIEQIGGRLYIRGTLPPKALLGKNKPYQQRISAANANADGVKIAERLAKKISVQIDAKTFDWADYLDLELAEDKKTIGELIVDFEKEYFLRRTKTFKTETTWNVEYVSVLKFLPQNDVLSIEILKDIIIQKSKPDTRSRKRFASTLTIFAKFAGLNADFSELSGNYSLSKRRPREIPSDKQIQDGFYLIQNDSWRWVYGIMSAYGLRNHEVFYVDLATLKPGKGITITDGKTGSRIVWPLHPEWFDVFELAFPKCPKIDLDRPNRVIGETVTRYFRRANIPFSPYDLRHAWAIRSLEYGIDISLAAKQMGHSLEVHSRLYHSWIDEKAHQRAFDLALSKRDRPLPP